MSDVEIRVPVFCENHTAEIVRRGNYLKTDPWRALLIAANIAMFQGASGTPSIHKQIGGQIERISELRCLACCLPSRFEKLCRVMEEDTQADIGKIKTLGEKWVKEGMIE